MRFLQVEVGASDLRPRSRVVRLDGEPALEGEHGFGVSPQPERGQADVHGEQLVHSGITLSPTTVQDTSSQFAAH